VRGHRHDRADSGMSGRLSGAALHGRSGNKASNQKDHAEDEHEVAGAWQRDQNDSKKADKGSGDYQQLAHNQSLALGIALRGANAAESDATRPPDGHVRAPSDDNAAVKRRTSARIADLSLYGASGFYFFGLLIGGALIGAALGWLVNSPGDGSAIGGMVGLACWLGLIITSFPQLSKYEGRRRQGPDDGDGEHRP